MKETNRSCQELIYARYLIRFIISAESIINGSLVLGLSKLSKRSNKSNGTNMSIVFNNSEHHTLISIAIQKSYINNRQTNL